MISHSDKIYVAGHRGMAGSAILRRLQQDGYRNFVLATSDELDLRDRQRTFNFLEENRPDVVIVAAAKVGGIRANAEKPVEFLSENLQIQTNILDASLSVEVRRLLFLGSSCIYPKFAPQPIPESALLTGHLEPTNDAYAIAKIAGLKHVEAVRREYGLPWVSVMPCNLYGPGDNYDPETSHVLPAMIARYVHAAKLDLAEVTNWGTGSVRREFLHVDDLADAVLHVLLNYNSDEHINIGTGEDLTLRELAQVIAEATGYQGATNWDSSKPDGTPRKVLDIGKLAHSGWSPKITLADGVRRVAEEYSSRIVN